MSSSQPRVFSEKRGETTAWSVFADVGEKGSGKNTGIKEIRLGPIEASSAEVALKTCELEVDKWLHAPKRPRKGATAGASSSVARQVLSRHRRPACCAKPPLVGVKVFQSCSTV